jgi:transcriptional regulator with XRE-family HTH domain
MLAKQTLAKRLREARHRRRMTLKEVERLSGFSSTHISEIERGRTSPTVKALVRIAEALAKDPCYFVESRELDDVSFVAGNGVQRRAAIAGGLQTAPLTTGILGGRLEAYLLRTGGPHRGPLESVAGCDACFYGLEGSLRLQTDEGEYRVERDESLHVRLLEAPEIVTEGPLEVLLVMQPHSGGHGRRAP